MFVVDAGCSLQMGSRMSATDQPLLDRRTQWHVLSATIKVQAASVQIRAGRLPAACLGSAPTTTFASPSTVRWSSADDAAIEPTCSGLGASPTVPKQASTCPW